jgi:hypothetical protein
MSRKYASSFFWAAALVLLCSWTYAISCPNDCPSNSTIRFGSCSYPSSTNCYGKTNPNDQQFEWACWGGGGASYDTCYNCQADFSCPAWTFSRCNSAEVSYTLMQEVGCRTGFSYGFDTSISVSGWHSDGGCC